MKYFIFTFGCQMNTSDSEKIEGFLKHQGYKRTSSADNADLIVFNSCSVRQTATDRIYGLIRNYPTKKIIITGCLLDFDKECLSKNKNVSFWHPDDYYNLVPFENKRTDALVPIMTGCNNFCSYCVVPFTRGREKSRPAQEILDEIKLLSTKGSKSIVLLGQNVNSYKSQIVYSKKKVEKISFSRLLQMIDSLPGSFWLSFLTSHPKDMSDELINILSNSKKVTPHIHLPVQSGDNEILKKMNRHYTIAHYKNLVKKIRTAFNKNHTAFPPLAISTDIIVGFPGETEKQFQNTLKLIRDIKFDMIYFAQYSARPGTAAARLKDNVTKKEKKRRAELINATLKKIASSINKKYLGKNTEVLVYEMKKDFAIGKTASSKNVRLPKKGLTCGDLITVKIISTTAWGLNGTVTKNKSPLL